jgi:hypothetical protein
MAKPLFPKEIRVAPYIRIGVHCGTEGKKVRPRAASHSCFASSFPFFHPKCPRKPDASGNLSGNFYLELRLSKSGAIP